MKAVLDVGIFVSATINPRGHPAQIIQAWREGSFELVTSYSILEDLRRVLHYPHIWKRHRWIDEEILLFIDLISLAATITAGQLDVDAVDDDPADNNIVSCALEGKVDYIVASDQHLTSLGSFSNIPVVPPRRFLEILQQDADS